MNELHDAIARALCDAAHLGTDRRRELDEEAQLVYLSRADVCLTVLRHTLQQHPEQISELGWEQVGTWLLPEAYGPDYDHFTQTRSKTQPGICVAVFAPPTLETPE